MINIEIIETIEQCKCPEIYFTNYKMSLNFRLKQILFIQLLKKDVISSELRITMDCLTRKLIISMILSMNEVFSSYFIVSSKSFCMN